MPQARRKDRARTLRRRRPSRAIEVALAGLAHDIRTPLTGILALSELLGASDLPERERRWATAIRDAAQHLARLTTIVVDTAKAQESGLVLETEPFSPRALARSIAQSLSARAEAKSLAVDIAIAKDWPERVIGDAVRLRSALENLIDNAVKFTERGRIGFTAKAARAGRGRTRLTFTVADSGIGIVASDLKRLFRPFAQASEAVARRYGGAGLGLVFVKRIAEAMGGGLTVTSKPGRGSTFRLTVAVEPGHAARAAGRPVPAPSLRVLVAADDPYSCVVLNDLLNDLGHRVSFAGSGKAAVAAAQSGAHDVVLLDDTLADADGIRIARRIRALAPPAGRLPIIGVSGNADADAARAARAAGMDASVHKPIGAAALRDALDIASAKLRSG